MSLKGDKFTEWHGKNAILLVFKLLRRTILWVAESFLITCVLLADHLAKLINLLLIYLKINTWRRGNAGETHHH